MNTAQSRDSFHLSPHLYVPCPTSSKLSDLVYRPEDGCHCPYLTAIKPIRAQHVLWTWDLALCT